MKSIMFRFSILVACLMATSGSVLAQGPILNRDGSFNQAYVAACGYCNQRHAYDYNCRGAGNYGTAGYGYGNQGRSIVIAPEITSNNGNTKLEIPQQQVPQPQSEPRIVYVVTAPTPTSVGSADLSVDQRLENAERKLRMIQRDAEMEERLPHAANTAREERAQERARVRAEIRAERRRESKHDHETDWVTITNNVANSTLVVSATLDQGASIHKIPPGEELEIEMDCEFFKSRDWTVKVGNTVLRTVPQSDRDSEYHYTYTTPEPVIQNWLKTDPETQKFLKSQKEKR